MFPNQRNNRRIEPTAEQKESQIYNWGIKKDTSLDGVRDDKNRKSHGISSDVSNTKVPQKVPGVNNNISNSEQNNTQADPNGPANFMPDGTEFVLDKEKDTESQSARVTYKNEGQRSAKDSVSNNKLTQPEPIVKDNISEEAQDYSQNDGEIKQSFALDNPTKEETVSSEAETTATSDKPTERFIKTIIETGTLSDEMLEGMHKKLLLGDFSYEVMSDKAQSIKGLRVFLKPQQKGPLYF